MKRSPVMPKHPKNRGQRARALVNALEALKHDLKPADLVPDSEIPEILNQNAARRLVMVASTALDSRSV